MFFPLSAKFCRAWRLLIALAAFTSSASLLSGQAATTPSGSPRIPVLVELFTSEGCSDCPPADALLAKLDGLQPFAGVQVIVLSEHVTYWNHEGWSDPFSFDAMTERQEQYERRFGLDASYTPQMVVDGTEQFVGSNARALTAAVQKQIAIHRETIAIQGAKWEHGVARFSLLAKPPAGASLVAVLAADATHSDVAHGENAGRKLQHTAVVRVMKEFGSYAADGRSLDLAGGPLTKKGEEQGPVRLVVFLVDHKSGHVLGAAEQTISR